MSQYSKENVASVSFNISQLIRWWKLPFRIQNHTQNLRNHSVRAGQTAPFIMLKITYSAEISFYCYYYQYYHNHYFSLTRTGSLKQSWGKREDHWLKWCTTLTHVPYHVETTKESKMCSCEYVATGTIEKTGNEPVHFVGLLNSRTLLSDLYCFETYFTTLESYHSSNNFLLSLNICVINV